MTGVSGMIGVAPGVDAPGVEALGVEAPEVKAAGVEAPGVEVTGDEAAGVDAAGVPPGVVPGVAGMTTTGAKLGLSARDSSRGVDVMKRASLMR